jgi:DNA-binding transcriptional regulator YhcF (GntR family)
MRSPEEILLHDLTLAIARGSYRAGELLPPEPELAHQLLIAPSKIAAAYRGLETRGLVVAFGDHRTMVVESAEMRARACLLETLKTDIEDDLVVLRGAGCSSAEMRSAVESVLARLRSEEDDR